MDMVAVEYHLKGAATRRVVVFEDGHPRQPRACAYSVKNSAQGVAAKWLFSSA